MDQDEFRNTYHEMNERYCAFEKSILTNQCHCSKAEKFCIAEREGVHCQIDEGQSRCLEILDLLREQAKFSLRTGNQSKGNLPHGKAIKIQVGGMLGIVKALDENKHDITDIDQILLDVLKKYSTFSALPFSQIMQQIAAYKIKKRARRKKTK